MALIFSFAIVSAQPAFAVESLTQSTSSTSSVRRNIATIMFAGLGGAVLGISTLSFYPDAANHINNITVGLAIGLIAGTAYVTSNSFPPPPARTLGLDPLKEIQAHSHQASQAPPAASWQFTF